MRRLPLKDIPVNPGVVVEVRLRNLPGLPDRVRRRVFASVDEAHDFKALCREHPNFIDVCHFLDLTLNRRVIDYAVILYAHARLREGWRQPAEVHEAETDPPDNSHSGPAPPTNLLARRLCAVPAANDDPSHAFPSTTRQESP